MPNQPCYVPVWHMHLETSSLSYKCNTQNKVHKFICWKFWQQQYYMYGIFILQKSMLHIYIYIVAVCPNFSFWQNYLMILICSLCYDYLIGHDYFTFLIFPFRWPSPILLQKKNIFINSRPNDTDAAVWVNFIIMTFEISATAWSSSHGGISSPKEIVAAAAVPVCVLFLTLLCLFNLLFKGQCRQVLLPFAYSILTPHNFPTAFHCLLCCKVSKLHHSLPQTGFAK